MRVEVVEKTKIFITLGVAVKHNGSSKNNRFPFSFYIVSLPGFILRNSRVSSSLYSSAPFYSP